MPYISQNTVEKVKQLDIVQVIEKYLPLKKSGASYKAHSPFTSEQTPSFTVTPSKQIYKCFSTGKGGDAINFVEQLKNYTFSEAVEEIAKAHSIEIEYENLSEEKLSKHQEAKKQREQIQAYLETAQNFFATQQLPKNNKTRPWSKATLETFGIGYAPDDWTTLCNYLTSISIEPQDFSICGLVALSKKETWYDVFRNRITFPFHDYKGNLVGFIARSIGTEEPKYLYLDSKAWEKSQHLYGLHLAIPHIQQQDCCYLVEGATDVIAMHRKGIQNVVAIGGSMLTDEQIKLLRKFTDTIIMFPDNDCAKEKNAGLAALRKNAHACIASGFYVKVLVPRDRKEPLKKSVDPEEFLAQFTDGDKEELNTFFSRPMEYITDFLLTDCKDHSKKGFKEQMQAVNIMAGVVNSIAEIGLRNLVHDEVCKLWQDYKQSIGNKAKEDKLEVESNTIEMHYFTDADGWKNLIPVGVDFDDKLEFVKEYQYFEHGNRVWMCAKPDYRGQTRTFMHVSNFVFQILFHLYDEDFPQRLIKFTNVQGKEMIEAVRTDDMSTHSRFAQLSERLGNYLWTGGKALDKVKEYQFMQEKSGVLKETLGHDKDGFYAMSNGVYNYEKKEWIFCDSNGVVQVGNKCYYIPSGNSLYANNEYKFQQEKLFFYRPNKQLFFKDWAIQYYKAYPLHGPIGLTFFIASMFADHVFSIVESFPLLFIFGSGGSGKGSLIKRLTAMLGEERKALVLSADNTEKGTMRLLAQFCNASLLADEYYPEEKTNKFLKNVWDRNGYTKGNIKSKYGNDTIPINTTLMVTSNYEPNDEPLFTRIIYMIINEQSFTEEQSGAFELLREFEKQGLGDVLLEILALRTDFVKNFESAYKIVFKELKKEMDFLKIDRMVKNTSVLLATFDVVNNLISLPYNRQTLKTKLIDATKIQQQKIDTGGEVALFFSIIQFLYQKAELHEGMHFQIKDNQLAIKYALVYSMFEKEYINRERKKPPSKMVLLETLKKSDLYIETKSSYRFEKGGQTSAVIFDLEKTGFEVIKTSNYVAVPTHREPEQETEAVFGEKENIDF